MDCRQTMKFTLVPGETRQVLVEAKTLVLLTEGRIALRAPLLWLAETMVAQETELMSERPWVIEQGGWVALRAISNSGIVLIPPEGVALWRQVGRCLDAFFRTDKENYRKA